MSGRELLFSARDVTLTLRGHTFAPVGQNTLKCAHCGVTVWETMLATIPACRGANRG